MRVLVLGGAGYIGAHVCRALAARGDTPITFDNLSTGHERAVQWGPLQQGDIRSADDLNSAFSTHKPDAVMHFAANIEVSDGERDPLSFWDNNVRGVVSVLQAMETAACDRIVFSSTCATYGYPETLPLTEGEPQTPINVYGRTKLAVETMLADVASATNLRHASLRYFNAAGASPDADIGEEHDPETHLIPNALKAAAGIGGRMSVFGTDYDTPDGTSIRDYVHVVDLASAHLAALDRIVADDISLACNLGSGVGYSVLEVLNTVSKVTGLDVPHDLCGRRPGDPPRLVADIAHAKAVLGFNPVRSGLETIIEDAWRFHRTRWNLVNGPQDSILA